MFKRLLSLTLCILMLAAMAPTNFAFAEGEGSFSISNGGSLRVGGTRQLALNGVGATDTIVWTSEDTGIATVDQSGLVSGVALGETQIQAVRTYKDENDEMQVETRTATVSVVTYYNVAFAIPSEYSYGEGVSAPTPPAQEVIAGQKAAMPEAPALPEGYYYFVGWNLNGSPYSFDTPVTGDITLTAEFSDKHLVSFLNADGTVLRSIPVTGGDTLLDPQLDVVPPADHSFTGEWKIEETNETFIFGSTPVNKNLRLVPQFIHTYYVYFNSGGSSVAPRLVGAYQTISNPPIGANAPTREGYTFVHWYLDNENTPFNFNTTQITSTTVLTAKWTPKTVNYQIVYWIEKANISGDPGENANNYQYVTTVTKTAQAGSTVSASSTVSGASIYVNAASNLTLSGGSNTNKIASFHHGSTAVVSGTGTTVINAYYSRDSFLYTFDLGNGGQMVKDDKTYYGSDYTFSAKYGQGIESLWPSSANATITNGSGTNNKFQSWSPRNMRETSGLASKRFTLDRPLLPNTKNGTGGTLTATYSNPTRKHLNYWLEALPGESGEVLNFDGTDRTYALSELHSQVIDVGGTMTAKSIAGFSHVRTVLAETSNGEDIYNFYYSRAKFTLSFDTQMSGVTVDSVSDLPHGSPLLGFKPADPVVEGKVFLGWYYEAERRTAVDWENDTMPVGNLRLFANWESNELTANFYMDETLRELLHHAGVEHGRTIADPNLFSIGSVYDVNGNLYDPDAGVELKGVFKGWYWFLPGSYNRSSAAFSFETMVTENITLFGRWDVAGFKVTYEWGINNGGTLPADSNTYAYGAGALVLGQGGLSAQQYTLTGWQINGTGPAYYPGAIIRITGDTRLVAQWTRTNVEMKLTFHKNVAGDAATVIWAKVPKGGQLILPGSELFTRDDGYALVGWNTRADGSGTFYEIGGLYTTTNISNVSEDNLYAVWAPANFQVIYNAGTATGDPSLRDMPASPVSQLMGGQVQIPALAPTRFGMDFQGWGTNDLGTPGQILPAGTIFTMPGHNVTLTALWKAKQFTITFVDGWDGTEDVQRGTTQIGTKTVPYGDSATLITNLPQHDHWLFDHWVVVNDDGSESMLYETMLLYITANLKLRAKWKPAPKYSTTYVDEDGTTVLQEPISESQGVPIPPYTGETPTKAASGGVSYTFDKWVLHEGTPGANNTVGTTNLVYKASYKASFIPYTVTYHWDSAEVPDGQTPPAQLTDKNVGNPINIAPIPAVTGWTFDGWYTKTGSKVGVAAGDRSFTMPAGNVDLYGAWTHNAHTVSYAWDEGSAVPAYQTLPPSKSPCYYGETIYVAADLVQPGWTFTGWYTKTGSAVTVGSEQESFSMPNDSVTLYGRWERNTYTVTYMDEDGTSVLQAAISAFYGDEVPAFAGATPTKADNNGVRYTFSGWTLSLGSLIGGKVGITNLVFQATYSEAFIDYTVSYAWDGEAPTSARLPDPQTGKHIGNPIGVADAPVVTGWTFTGWYTKTGSAVTVQSGDTEFTMPASDVVLYGSWTQNNYKVTYAWENTSPLADSNLPAETTTNHYGDDITVAPDLSAPGWTFTGWHTLAGALVTVGDDDLGFTMPDGDVTLYGAWTAIDYTVTYINWDDEVLQGPDTVHIGDAIPGYTGDAATRPDDNGVRYTFVKWELVEGTPQNGKVGTTDLVYQAIFSDTLINYTVTYHWDTMAPDAAGNPPTALSNKNVNDEINLVFPATVTGWTFNGWYTKGGSPVTVASGDAGFTMPAGDVDLYGSWLHKEHTVSYAWETGSPVPDGHTVPGPFAGNFYNDKIDVEPDQVEPGWIFTGWHTEGKLPVMVLDTDLYFMMPDEDVTLYASWEKIIYTVTYENWDGTELYVVDPLYIGNSIPAYVGATPTRPDANGITYTFSGWTLISGTPGANNTIGVESLVYRAAYDSDFIDYRVTYAWESGSPLPVGEELLLPDDNNVYHVGNPVTVAADASTPGWTFTGWHTAAGETLVTVGDSDTGFTMPAGNVTLYGSWAMIDYTVTYVDENGTTVLQSAITVNIGDDVPAFAGATPTKADNNGVRYTFSGWTLSLGSLIGGKVGITNLVFQATYSEAFIDYTVSYAWDGEAPTSARLPDPQTGKNIGNPIGVADAPVVTGWTFTGWYTKTGSAVTVQSGDTEFTMPASDVVLYGSWTQNNYKVTYAWENTSPLADTNLPPQTTTNHYLDDIDVAPDLSAPGWIFTGWHTLAGASVTVGDDDTGFSMPADDVTLYGSWAKIPYTVTYVDENGTTVLQSAITAYIGDTIPAYTGSTPTKPDNNGITYTFAGWNLKEGTEGAGKTIGTTDLVYIATYGDAKIDYTVTYAWDGAAPTGAGLPLSLTEKHIGDRIDVAAAPVVTGWTFTGWYTAAGSPVTVTAGQTFFMMPAGNVTLYGSWTQNEYKVSYKWESSAVPSGHEVPPEQTGKHYNEQIEVAADPTEPGWTFTGWHTAASETLVTVGDSDTHFTMPDGSVTLYGSWAMIDYTVTYVDENGTTVLQSAITVNIGDDVPAYAGATPTKADNNGIRYTFKEFVLASGTLGADGEVGSTDLVYKAVYDSSLIDYTVSYAWESDSPLPPNANLLLPDPQTGKHIGDPINVAADAVSTGWTFIGWHTATGAPVTVVAGAKNFTMPASDVVLYGRWTHNPYSVTYAWEQGSPFPTGQSVPVDPSVYYYDQTVRVAADLSEPGWVFTGWHTAANANVTVGDSDVSFKMPDGSVTLYGRWEKLYTTTYVNYDDTVLQAPIERLAGELIPAYAGATPTKPDNNGVRYTFDSFVLVSGTTGGNGTVGTTNLVFQATYSDAFIAYKVSYAWDGAAPTGPQLPTTVTNHHVNQTINVAAAPVVTGWTFTGWYTKTGAPVTVVAGAKNFKMPAADVVLYGRWTQNEYTVTYAWEQGSPFPTGQSVPVDPSVYYYDQTVRVAADLSEPGWVFTGWHTAANANVTVGDSDVSFKMPDGSVTLYGRWAMIDYTVTYQNWDGATLQAPITVHIGDNIPVYAGSTPTRPDNNGVRYTFTGNWTLTGTEGPNKTVGTTNLVYKAVYSESFIDYSVSYAWDGAAPTGPQLPTTVTNHHVNQTINVAAAPVVTGWTFTGWYTKTGAPVTVVAGAKNFKMPAADVVLYGRWTQNEYTVTYAYEGAVPAGAAVLLPGKLLAKHYGDQITIAADPVLAGYDFDGWYTKAGAPVKVGASDLRFNMPADNVTLYGKWTQKNHTLTYTWDSSAPAGAVLPDPMTNRHYNDTVTLSTPKAVDGWLFLGWKSLPGMTPVVTQGQTTLKMPDNSVTLVGSWEKLYNVRYAWDTANGFMVPPTASLPGASLNQRAGTTITVAGKPSISGWLFEGWYTKDASGNRTPMNAASLRLSTADITLYGQWTKIGRLTATPYAQPYDGAAHGIGIVGEEGDTIYYSLDGTTWTTTPELRTDVQSAERIFIRAEQAGYTTRTANATITITPRVLSYGITAPETVLYGEGATVGYTLTGFVKGEGLRNLPGLTEALLQPVSPVDNRTNASPSQPYTVDIPAAVEKNADGSMKRFGNYAINPTDTAITVLPREITLIGDSFHKYVGAEEPVYTYRVVGKMVNGDLLSVTIARDDFSRDPGNYPLVLTELLVNGVHSTLNENYVFTYRPGSLTINALPTFTLTFIVRGGPYGSAGLTVYTRELIQGLYIQVPDYAVPSGYTFSGFSNVPEKMPPHAVTIYGDLSGGPEVREVVDPEFEWIEDEVIPLAAPDYRAWSLVNLIIAILTAFGAVLLLLGYLGKKKREANPAKGITEAKINRKGGWRLASLLPGLGAIIAFLLTENMTYPVVLLDSWTPLMVVIALIQVAVAILAGKKVTEVESEQTDSEA